MPCLVPSTLLTKSCPRSRYADLIGHFRTKHTKQWSESCKKDLTVRSASYYQLGAARRERQSALPYVSLQTTHHKTQSFCGLHTVSSCGRKLRVNFSAR